MLTRNPPFPRLVQRGAHPAEAGPPIAGADKRSVPAGAQSKRRVTQLDIARAAGVHNTTVSLALRNSPLIPDATRTRIRILAESMGYRPDPALSALIAYRNGLMANRRTETIAYVTNGDSRWGWRAVLPNEQFFLGAKRRAAECGYQLEHFWLGEPDMSPRRMSSMLFHRGITGVLLGYDPTESDGLHDLDWERLSAIRIGLHPHAPALHRVTHNPMGGIQLGVRRAMAAGYRRPGLILPVPWDAAADQAYSYGFTTEQNRLAEENRIPIFLHQLPGFGSRDAQQQWEHPIDAEKLGKWFDQFRPDVVLGFHSLVSGSLADIGIQIPSHVAFVDLLLEEANQSVAGVRQNCERAGELSAEILIGQLQQNIRGLPSVPTTTSVESVWCDGASLPPASFPSWTQEGSVIARTTPKHHAHTAA